MLYYNYTAEWEVITNSYVTVSWCLLGCKRFGSDKIVDNK